MARRLTQAEVDTAQIKIDREKFDEWLRADDRKVEISFQTAEDSFRLRSRHVHLVLRSDGTWSFV